MAWIKRNLFFVIGGVVAVLLLGLAGFYDFKNWERNSKALAALNEAYQTLRQLGSQTPSPGNDEVNNIAAARQQTQEVRAWIARASQYFQPVPPIPRPANGALTSKDFADALSRTVARMQDEAAAASVALPAQFSFSFTVQQQGLRFAPGSLLPLAQQLGDVKAICDIVFDAKVNALDDVRRVPVSSDDLTGPQGDYLQDTAETNALAVFTPYELTFRGFSQDVADVMSGFASSPYGFIVKGMNVQPASAASAALAGAETPGGPAAYGQTYNPPGQPYGQPFDRRYGRPYETPYGAGYPPATPAYSGGLQTVISEQLLSVTMEIEVVRLLPQK